MILEKNKLEVQYVLQDTAFMFNKETGETVEGPLEFFGASKNMLVPGLEVTGFFHEGMLAMGRGWGFA